MKYTLRCHGFGEKGSRGKREVRARHEVMNKLARQNRASPQGVAAKIAASFVARLANIDILAAPRFALSTIFSRNARAFHYVRDSTRVALAAIACALLAAGIELAAAQGKISVEDLKVRAEAGDKTATRQLAELYYVGREGVEQNFSEAARWYLKLAQQGDVRAQTTMGLMYSRGYGVKKDPQAAHRWWSFAAAANDPGAQFNLGLTYANGDGVAQDYPQAVQWYSKAAQRAHVQAQFNLGMLYHEGKGVARDPVRAYYWVKVAALQGDDLAQDMLKKVGAGMSAEQVREAEAQADDWMKKAKKLLK